MHHFGFWVDDEEEAIKAVEANGGTYHRVQEEPVS